MRLPSLPLLPGLLVLPLVAQEAPPAPSSDSPLHLKSLVELLNTPVITATRWATSQEEAPATLFVLEAREIRQMAATSVPDLLRSIPGLDVQRAWDGEVIVGSRGLATLNNAKLLVLVDGRRVNLDYNGGVRWRELPLFLEEIERIEVSLSPLSALYGANAFGGLIQIVTKRPEARPRFQARAVVGEKESQGYLMALADSRDRVAWSVAGGWARSEGFGNRHPSEVDEDVLGPDNRTRNGAGKFKDGWELGRLTVDLDVEGLGGGNLQIRLGAVTGDESIPSLSSTALKMANNATPTRNAFGWGAYSWRLSPHHEARAVLSSSQWVDRGHTQPFSTRTQTAEFQIFSTLGDHQVTSGLTAERTSGDSPELSGGSNSEDLTALYLQDNWRFSAFTLNAGLRYDKHTDLTGRFSPRAALVWSFGKGHSLRAGFGTAFRKPSIQESYIRSIPPGNPATTGIVLGEVTSLGQRKAERISAAQLDYLVQAGDDWLFRLNLFRNTVEDLISLRKVQPYSPYQFAVIYDNQHDLRITGAEAEVRWAPRGPVNGFLNLSHQDLDYLTSPTTDRLGVPRWKANLGLTFHLPGDVNGSVILHRVGSHTPQFGQVDPQGNYHFMQIPAYTTVDLKLFQVRSHGTARIEYGVLALNLFDREHIEFPIFDGNAPYFGFSAVYNYTADQRRMYENRNALNDRVLSVYGTLRF
ncbi:MAG TPA: TonB-dependent receptor [Holophagaceae bacterium]|nr:TonB-dependent receptor [Holophagaceae bacterium]